MTRDHALAKAKEMREFQLKWLAVSQNLSKPWGHRYEAVIKAEDCEYAAKQYDKHAEREKAK